MSGGTSPDHDDDSPSQAGNPTVNDSADEQSPDGLGSDELALRRMLHEAVRTVEPADGTLDHLRRAVPARRTRKRHAAIGMAAAALFVGTAVPALLHVSGVTDSDVDPSVAGQASRTPGEQDRGKDKDGEGRKGGADSEKAESGGDQGDKAGDKGKDTGTGKGGTGGTGSGTAGTASAAQCTADQLGSATQNTEAPDSVGTVYGTFRVYNVSATTCTVSGAGTVSTLAQGAADGAKVTTARHTAGDAAAGLPDPAGEVTFVSLKPGDAYAVRFAWVPSETCPTTGGSGGTDTGGSSPEPTPSEGAGGGPGTTAGGTDSSGLSGQFLTEDGTADGSVVVSHTAPTGSPTVSVTVGNACAGTVYYTGLLTGV
ncbi:hypothetical protein ACIQKE_30000 [Streptomyces griseoviridis]|uniref:hypothetical protein n=1 Tax=Streptomyces griseoviridis TaxID=45398 RepID=UPI001F0B98BF|nr:hypothetical protein [Streptomyces griseoviridis]